VFAAGLNNNAYQISRALYHNGRTGRNLDQISRFVKADFMNMPFENSSFDAVYQIDATCHAPDQVGCYKVRGDEYTIIHSSSSSRSSSK
jgi:sterol 24-C-methyltransferase